MLRSIFTTITLASIAFFLSLSTVFAQNVEPSSPSPAATVSPEITASTSTPEMFHLTNGPTFVAGESVTLDQSYPGAVFAAGGSVTISGNVTHDLVVAGGTIRLTGTVGQDVYAAGGTIFIDGQVTGNVITAGGEVQVGPTAQIGGTVMTATERLSVAGPVGGSVLAGVNRVLLNAPVGGDVWVGGESLNLGHDASVGGDVRAKVGEPLESDPAASVAGTIQVDEVDTEPQETVGQGLSLLWKGVFRVVWRTALLMLGLFALPSLLRAGAKQLETAAGQTFLSGIVSFIGLPFLMLVLAVTVVGLPIAGLVLLAYLLVFFTVWAIPSLWAGQKVLPGQNQYLQALIGVAVVVALGLLPVVGALIQLVIAVFGFGVMVRLGRSAVS